MTEQEKSKLIAAKFRMITRRDMLRTSSLATAGIVLMPSFIPGCRKYDLPNPEGPVGETPINYAAAAVNLANMRAFVKDLYDLSIEYDNAVFTALASTKGSNWENFIIDIFIDMATVMASAAAIISEGAGAVPAFAFLSAILHDWGIGKDKPGNLQDEFADFEFGHNQMQLAMEQKLSSLEDPTNNYSNLATAWNNPIEFNGQNYTVGDLASAHFPTSGEGDKYNPLQTAAYTSFKRMVWNLVIMKCCTYYRNYGDGVTTAKQSGSLLKYMRETYYPKYKGVYVRADLTDFNDDENFWAIYAYNLGIGGYAFPDSASAILFKDDTPGNIINPDGLFNRSYVFQQFSITKPVFEDGSELATAGSGADLDETYDWNFTGGDFPSLIKE